MCQEHTRCKLQIPQQPYICRECRRCIGLRILCTRHCRCTRYGRPWTARGQGMLVCVCVCVCVYQCVQMTRPHITTCLHHLDTALRTNKHAHPIYRHC